MWFSYNTEEMLQELIYINQPTVKLDLLYVISLKITESSNNIQGGFTIHIMGTPEGEEKETKEIFEVIMTDFSKVNNKQQNTDPRSSKKYKAG